MSRKTKSINGGLGEPSREPIVGASGGNPNGIDQLAGGNTDAQVGTEPSPPVATIGGIEIVDPAGAGEPLGSEPRRRGRPPGVRGSKKVSANLTKLDGLILSAHLVVSRMMSVPELEIDAAEAADMAAATQKLLVLYVADSFSEKKVAWGEFIMCCAAIYGPRAVAIYKRKPEHPIVPPARHIDTREPEQQPKRAEPESLAGLTPFSVWPQSGNDGGSTL